MPKVGTNIYRRKDGRYEGRVLTEKTPCRKSKYIYVYGKTLREVRDKMEAVRNGELSRKIKGQPSMQTASQEWLAEMKAKWKPTTYDLYARIVRQYIDPILGSYAVSEIDRNILKTFSEEMVNRSRDKKLSDKYRRYACSIVCQIIEYISDARELAVKMPGMPDFCVSKDEIELPDAKSLDKLEAYLMEHLEDDTCLGILFAMYTGIRIGELCALQWNDIDLENGVVSIHRNLQRIQNHAETEAGKTKIYIQKPKSTKSVRMLPIADGLLEILKQYRKEPEKYLISGRKAEWAEIRTVQYRFTSILKKCGIGQFHFHLLRHAFASRCISAGCDVKSLSELLGHSSVQITMNVYVHSSMRLKKEMVNNVCRLKQ